MLDSELRFFSEIRCWGCNTSWCAIESYTVFLERPFITAFVSVMAEEQDIRGSNGKDARLLPWWSTSLKVCDTHRPKLLKEAERLVGQELWDALPSIFGLPGWSSTRNVNDEVSD